ncbi:hypothetical protein VB834_14810 [Limnoraphis robusta Tam1]|uniref:Uncharacterized protein n=1 Tax=Limnoraphis robusta CCNP1315 TaxID=3110306 RepID=A0ABU5U5D7_9CYAN|nr:hypothetical protein [Limnoraphis robusta]MEA5521368.1 hypothetical protein [Limnoraphis robusta CCNP1315]MEA5540295.1 hypothetical protein [Limnoraphis robusta Tam1]MEA5547955.1 hypothetical protein [Limnoraphis robusta CCNP1324]
MQLFDEAQNADREQRYMMTGNLLKAADKFGSQGKIVHYTDRVGERHPGFLMRKSFEPTRDLANAPVRLTEVEHIENFTKEHGLTLHTRDARLSFFYDEEDEVYGISVPKSKKAGGEFFLDKKLLEAATLEGVERNEFYSRGDSSYLYFSPDELESVVERLDEKWGLYAIGKEDAAIARELVGLEIPDFEEILATAFEVQQELRASEDVEPNIASPTLSVIDGGKLSITSDTETVETTNSPQVELEVESDITQNSETETVQITNSPQVELEIEPEITQNSETETVEIRKLESQNSEQATTDSTLPEASPGEVEFFNSQEDLQEQPLEISETNINEIEIEQSELIQQQRVQIVAPITNELLKFVGENRYEGSQNIAYRQDDTLNIETLEHQHLMGARWDETSRNWYNINSNLSDEDVSHFQSIQAVLVQRIDELERNKQQQEFVGRLAPLIADYHDLASDGEKANLGYCSTSWDTKQQVLTLIDEEKGEEILTAQLTDKR